jgi:hypothetical protein
MSDFTDKNFFFGFDFHRPFDVTRFRRPARPFSPRVPFDLSANYRARSLGGTNWAGVLFLFSSGAFMFPLQPQRGEERTEQRSTQTFKKSHFYIPTL